MVPLSVPIYEAHMVMQKRVALCERSVEQGQDCINLSGDRDLYEVVHGI